MKGRFLLCLHSHMPYVLSHGVSPHGTDWLFESAAECYLPILDALDRMRHAGICPRWTINMTPILAEQLDDEAFKQGFIAYCEGKIAFAKQDQERFEAEGELGMVGTAGFWQRFYSRSINQFKNRWGNSICGALKGFQDDGLIELITCGATHGYLPLLSTDESVDMQVSVAVESHTKRFGKPPKGIWLPECAYRPAYEWKAPAGENPQPWQRKGVEQVLEQHGLNYFFVDSHLIRGGVPLGTYWASFPQLAEVFARSRHLFTPPSDSRSEYEHYEIPGGMAVFARDPKTTVRVWSGDVGYPGNEWYLEFHKQLYPGRLRYWRISQEKSDLGRKAPYDPWAAFDQIAGHVKDLVGLVKSTLADYEGVHGRPGTLVAMYDTELFGHWWFEGPEFLYQCAVAMSEEPDLELVTGSDVLENEPPRHLIHLPEGSWGEGGYHSVWLNSDNHWTWERLYPAEATMRELATKCTSGISHRIATQAGRELLLAEASDWQFLISTFSAKDYAEIRFADHIERFERLAKMAIGALSKSELTAEELIFLEDCELKDAPFPDLDIKGWQPAANKPGSTPGVPMS